ncbi:MULTISPECIES: hypothetical protein [unclassified Streptomyces]|uniref:hypothetical protein n=1 Tax=unclassified Streptomyces TaxID=2593676 RepID=UPI002258DA1C|nr:MULTISPECIES: hypothetical protein [unclassified Streptomyces]MCX5063799.1 hypothetical protein [Streptomyces sp. NBC_00452]MCX5294143.1 hypothetical protein [Streptomyces sp. NBC_00183]
MAKYASLVLVAAAVAVYATAWRNLFWQTVQPAVIAAGIFTGALIYGRLGIVLAAVVRRELAGMFLTILISSTDLLLQNSLINAAADSAIVATCRRKGGCRPRWAVVGARHALQLSAAAHRMGSFTAGLGMTAFAARTRTYCMVSRTAQGSMPRQAETALVS